MKITEVKGKQQEQDFLDMVHDIYRGDPNWVCHLDKDIREVFDPATNNFFKHGVCTRWLLQDDAGKVIGRIAAFIDKKQMNDYDHPTGGVGFFECINDQKAANLLFDTAKEWLGKQGVQAMNGPINFGETDKYWGLLVDGFTQPAYKIAYNPKYYQNLWENYGFKIFYKQEGFHLSLSKEIPARFWKIAEWVAKKPDYSFEHIKFNDIEKYVKDFTHVFNEAWRDFKKDFEPLSEDYVRNFITKGKMILEEKFIWFGYNKGEPIAIYFMYPDFNQVFKAFNGKLTLWNKLKLVYKAKTGKMTRARGVLMGVVPKFQGMGIESAFIFHLNTVLRAMPLYTELEFSWVGDFNPPMRKIWTAVGAVPAKHYITYRYLFDRNAEYKRYPIPDEKGSTKY